MVTQLPVGLHTSLLDLENIFYGLDFAFSIGRLAYRQSQTLRGWVNWFVSDLRQEHHWYSY